MKTIKIMMSTLIASVSFITTSWATDKSAVVLSLYTTEVDVTPETAGNMLRIELEKTGFYNILDKHDLKEILVKKNIQLNECYGKECLFNIGSAINVDFVFSGSIENIGKKIVVNLKVLDVATNKYCLTAVQEFIYVPNELQLMIQITMNKMLGRNNNEDVVNTLIYYQQPPETPKTKISNSGPRVGLSIVHGEMADRLSDPESEGGWDAVPVFSQFGYQFEKAYLSAGNFNALIEGMFIISGPEQGIFNPKFVLMNGFRSSKNGLEFAFGPSFGIEKSAKSYYDEGQGKWFLASQWNQRDIDGNLLANPYPISRRMDNRGETMASLGWVIGVGKTFSSGYLNIPINMFASFNKDGWQSGLSVGFNITKNKKSKSTTAPYKTL
jgi:hypothetical protein